MESPPPWREGGRVGFTLDTFTEPDSSGRALDLLLRIPPATIAQLSRDENGDASLRVLARVASRAHGRPLESNQILKLPAADSAFGQGNVTILRFPGAPGSYQVSVKVSDLLSHKPGLLHGSDAYENAEVDGTIDVPGPQAGRDFSDIEFLWPVSQSTSDLAFVRNGRTVVPNPDRLYGLMATELRARFVARAAPQAPDRPWHWVARVFDSKNEGIAQSESTSVATPLLDAEVSFDVSSLPAGAYDLEVKAWQEGDPGALLRRATFSIGWKADTWFRNAGDVADDVHFLLTANAEDDFVVLPPGEQERILQEFWARRDPTPETAQNEAYDTFRERVRHANMLYTRAGVMKGMFTDMGRVYIRYGEPSEVLHQVMPAGNETLAEELQQIIDTEDRLPDGMGTSSLGGDMRPYEVWIYEGDIPMPIDVDPHDTSRGRPHRRILFLFVDDQDTGLYRLRYSTE